MCLPLFHETQGLIECRLPFIRTGVAKERLQDAAMPDGTLDRREGPERSLIHFVVDSGLSDCNLDSERDGSRSEQHLLQRLHTNVSFHLQPASRGQSLRSLH